MTAAPVPIEEPTEVAASIPPLLLRPGTYVLEARSVRPLSEGAVVDGLRSSSLFSNVRPDMRPEPEIVRVITTVDRACTLLPGEIAWRSAGPFHVPTTSGPAIKLSLPYPILRPGRRFELRLLARTRSHSSRSTIEESLSKMGLSIECLFCLEKDTRVPDRRDVAVSLWLGTARWEGPQTYASIEDDVLLLDTHEVDA